MAIETKVAFVIVRPVDALIDPVVAVMVVLPGATPKAKLLCGDIVATPVFDELQVTKLFRLCVLPSSKVPMALKDCDVFIAIVGFAGMMASEIRFASVTVSCVLP
jgi:hypothetical protein